MSENGIILTDVYEIAVLTLLGENSISTELLEGKVRFTFRSEAKNIIKDFYESKLTVDPKKYKHAIQDVRSIIYGLKKAKV